MKAVSAMTENYRDADAIVTIEGKEYALYRKGHGFLSKYPHMIEIAIGVIPLGEQLPLLKSYLQLNGINVEPMWNTHWCVCQAIKVAQERKI